MDPAKLVQLLQQERERIAALQKELATLEKELKATRSGTKRFTSLYQFLTEYRPQPWKLLPEAPSQSYDVKSEPPSSVVVWSTFESECRALLDALPSDGPIDVTFREPKSQVDGEEELHFEVLRHLLVPLQDAASTVDPFFMCGAARPGLKGLPGNSSARPDFLLRARDTEEVLAPIVLRTSAALCVPDCSSMPAVYTAAAAAAAKESGAASNIVKAVTQLYNYVDGVPYGVLLTDQQLFCVRREGTVLLCSPSIPVTGAVRCPADRESGCTSTAEQSTAEVEGGRGLGAGSLSAVAALYCIMKMSQQWWTQPPQPSGSTGGSSGTGGGAVGTGRRQSPLQMPFGGPSVLDASKGAAAAAAAAAASLPAAATESECTFSQLFPGHSLDPRVPGGVPRYLGASCWGAVLRGCVGGRPAAVKLVDTWQGPEGKEALQHEVRMYQKLQSLQGDYVPSLLGFGYCDGWQYFLATSLEGPALSSEGGWALGEAATCAAAFAALDAVHRCGVLHGDVELRNFVLALQPAAAAAGGGTAGGGGDGVDDEGQISTWRQLQQQQQPRVMLLDFGFSKLAAEAADERGVEPAVLIEQERMALQGLLDWEPSPSWEEAGSLLETEAAAAAGSGGGDVGAQQDSSDGASAGGPAAPSPPAARGGPAPPAGFLPAPPAPPKLACGRGGWRQQLRSLVPRTGLLAASRGGRGASRLALRRRM